MLSCLTETHVGTCHVAKLVTWIFILLIYFFIEKTQKLLNWSPISIVLHRILISSSLLKLLRRSLTSSILPSCIKEPISHHAKTIPTWRLGLTRQLRGLRPATHHLRPLFTRHGVTVGTVTGRCCWWLEVERKRARCYWYQDECSRNSLNNLCIAVERFKGKHLIYIVVL